MRPWLVVIGAAFVLVGAASLGGLLILAPPSSVEQEATEQLVADFTPADGFAMFLISGASHPHGTFTLHWNATGPIAAELNTGSCSVHATGCNGTVLKDWGTARNGTFVVAGALGADFVLSWTTAPTVTAVVNASSLVEWDVGSSLSIVDLFAEVASGLLAAVGAVALFLGLFLRGGFRGPPRIVSRSADDAAALSRATGPRTATTDDGSGPPRRGPPARSP